MKEEKIAILKEMIKNGYHLDEEGIERYCNWFSVEQIEKFQTSFYKWKKENS